LQQIPRSVLQTGSRVSEKGTTVKRLAQKKRFSLFLTIFIIFIVITSSGQSDSAANAVPAPNGAAANSRAVSFGHDGLLFTDEAKSTQLRVHGYIQGDGRFFSSDLKDQSSDKLLFRRIRPVFEGTLFKVLDFRFMPDFGQNNPQIQDIHVEWKLASYAKPRIGKFKTPLGLEALRSDSESTFAERSLASDLVPLREVGAQVGGALGGDSLNYAAGYFNGTPDGSNGNFEWRTSNEGVARIFLRPFLRGRVKPLRGFGVGLAGSSAHEHGALPKFKTVGQNTFFKYSSRVLADGQHNRLTPQAYYYWGPFGILGEYTVSSQEVRNQSFARRLSNQGWQATASLMLTGERNSYLGVRPQRAFEPYKGIRHLGGWELAGRYSRLRVDGAAFPLFADPKSSAAGAAEWAIGINWYLNRFTRIMNAYGHTNFRMAEQSLTPLHSENVVMSRLQFSF
jgi:phosphate-selective porin OprO and OprP